MLDKLLIAKNGDWRSIVSDKTDKTTFGFIINGRLNVANISPAIEDQLPADASGTDLTKSIKGHIKSAADFLIHGPDPVLEFSARQIRTEYLTLYGLARAAWKVKSVQYLPDRRDVQYPPGALTRLTDGLFPLVLRR